LYPASLTLSNAIPGVVGLAEFTKTCLSAKQSGAEMVTADEKLVNSLAGQFQIKWLGSFY
jgi:hypothetical protein